MSWETKKEHIVREMMPRLGDHLADLKGLANISTKESSVEV